MDKKDMVKKAFFSLSNIAITPNSDHAASILRNDQLFEHILISLEH